MSYQHAIVDDTDGPMRRNVCQRIGTKFYYALRHVRPELKAFRMDPKRPTFLEDFGFQVTEHANEFYFEKVNESFATYPDGKPRRWQGTDSFFLPKLGPRGSKA